jgi:plastocyanin
MKLSPALLACCIAASANADVRIVHVFNFEFSINPIGQPIVDAVINVGDTVRWEFEDEGHSATSVSGIPEVWDSGVLGAPASFEHTFTHVGTWHYYCQPHGVDLGNGTAAGMAGTITVRAGCYANCDGSTTPPILNVQDFSCYINLFAEGNTRANCDNSTTPPILNVQDFSCFLNVFAAGCS